MLNSRFKKVRIEAFFLLLSTMFLLAASAVPAVAEYPVKTLQTLLDRAQIEDLLVDYYAQLGTNWQFVLPIRRRHL
jgi:hypothetical protein